MLCWFCYLQWNMRSCWSHRGSRGGKGLRWQWVWSRSPRVDRRTPWERRGTSLSWCHICYNHDLESTRYHGDLSGLYCESSHRGNFSMARTPAQGQQGPSIPPISSWQPREESVLVKLLSFWNYNHLYNRVWKIKRTHKNLLRSGESKHGFGVL